MKIDSKVSIPQRHSLEIAGYVNHQQQDLELGKALVLFIFAEIIYIEKTEYIKKKKEINLWEQKNLKKVLFFESIKIWEYSEDIV